MSEKRIHQRIIAWTRIFLFDMNGKTLYEGYVRNLSKGGVFVASIDQQKFKNIKSAQRIKFRFELPSGPVNGIAEVAWIKPESNELGMKFVKIEDGLTHLMDFISSIISS